MIVGVGFQMEKLPRPGGWLCWSKWECDAALQQQHWRKVEEGLSSSTWSCLYKMWSGRWRGMGKLATCRKQSGDIKTSQVKGWRG